MLGKEQPKLPTAGMNSSLGFHVPTLSLMGLEVTTMAQVFLTADLSLQVPARVPPPPP